MKTIPENPQPGERYAAYVGNGGWDWFVYDPSCDGGEKWIACTQSEADARLLVFGAEAIDVVKSSLPPSGSLEENHFHRSIRAALTNLETPR